MLDLWYQENKRTSVNVGHVLSQKGPTKETFFALRTFLNFFSPLKVRCIGIL